LLVRNPEYYLKDKDGRALPYVDAVRLIFTKDPATDMRCSARGSSTDAALHAGHPLCLMKTVPDLQLYRVPRMAGVTMASAWRFDKAPYSDVRVRQALSMAIIATSWPT